jgi:hypothetical protein
MRALGNPYMPALPLGKFVDDNWDSEYSRGSAYDSCINSPAFSCRRVKLALVDKVSFSDARDYLTPLEFPVWRNLAFVGLRKRITHIKRRICEKLDHPESGARFIREHGPVLEDLPTQKRTRE